MPDLVKIQSEMKKRKIDNCTAIGGWPMPAANNLRMLYLNLGLNISIELPVTDILYSEPIPDGTAEIFWVDAKKTFKCRYEHPAGVPQSASWTAAHFIEVLDADDGGQTHTSTHTRFPYCR